MTTKSQIEKLIRGAAQDALREGLDPSALDDLAVSRPQDPANGDYASSLALKLARPLKSSPMAIAQKVVDAMPPQPFLSRVWAAAPGFINLSLNDSWLTEQVDAIRATGGDFGNAEAASGQRIQVEFVSGNPTGPLHVGHARGAVIGSALAAILRAAGHDVETEYYLNDAGTQVQKFGESLYARYGELLGRDLELPEGGYHGDYVTALAREILDQEGDRFLEMPEADAARELGEIAIARVIEGLKADLASLRVQMDVWFSERTLFDDGQYDRSMKLLSDGGYLGKWEGATWFTSTALGDDKDNVLVRSTGAPTYLASDVAYHYNKFLERRFDRAVNIWGADHQGHVSRMKALVSALGVDPKRLTLMISQMVALKRGGEVVRLSKRSGELITLRELVDEVGPDACRYVFLSRSPQSQMEFDMELAKKESDENPVYYVQYAHARIAGVLRLADERSISYSDGDTALLTDPSELALIRKMLVLPELIEMMAEKLEPHHLPHYATELATAFHWFYQQCRVVSSDPEDLPVTRARLKLVDAARAALARCLRLMLMEAPERM